MLALMRKNPMRTAFIGIPSSTAIWFLYDYTQTSTLMQASCREAARLGDRKLPNPLARVRHITVILNPVAGKRKSKKLYTKWVEPLLHLSGIKVSLIETEKPSQAYELMKIMSNCDAVAIVGGDGTVHEALNGLLGRSDAAKAVRDFPIAILPTGQYNSIARYIHQRTVYRNQKEFLIHSTMKLIDSIPEQYDVLKILPLNRQDDTDESPVYALRDVRYGKYQDNFFKVSGNYLYQNWIKPYVLKTQRYFSRSYQKPLIESISYTNPCEGCSKCFAKHRLTSEQVTGRQEKGANRKWWSILAPVSSPNRESGDDEKIEAELATRENPHCDRWLKVRDLSELTDFRACMMGEKKIRLSLGRNGELIPSESIETQDIKLELSKELDSKKRSSSAQNEIGQTASSADTEADKKKDDSTEKFLIDGQPTQAHSIEITAVSKGVTIFSGLPA